MRILVTGARGQLGSEIRRCLETMRAEIGSIPAIYEGADVDCIDYDMLDIADRAAVDTWFFEHGPYDLVINCAAITNVDGCEQDEDAAYRVNALGAQNMAFATQACGGKLVHISTDYVFPGTDPAPRVEDDETGPTSAYGRTKLAGELLVMEACERSFIIRTAWLYGYVGNNFVKTMIRLARETGRIAVVNDQFGNPTNANDLAYEILKIAATEGFGVYHCTNKNTCSWFEFACAIVDAAGIACEKEGLSSEEYKRRFPLSADRPCFSGLVNAHLDATLGDEMRLWQDALNEYLEHLPELGD